MAKKRNSNAEKKKRLEALKDEAAHRYDQPIGAGEQQDRINPSAIPGSPQADTLSGRTSRMIGGAEGKNPPDAPARVPPYGRNAVDTTPEGASRDALTGTTTGGSSGSTARGEFGSMTGHRRELHYRDIPHKDELEPAE